MLSPHLAAERDRLLNLIRLVHDSGGIAPANVWISPAPKGKQLYYKLSSKNSDYPNMHLGKAGSEKYRDWTARIQRREAIAELEQQLSMLQALIDRQASVDVEIPGEAE